MHATNNPSPTAAFASPTRSSAIVAELIRELKDPRIGMVTITRGRGDARLRARDRCFFSLLVGDPAECETALNEAAGFLRNGLFKRLQIHTVPTLHFQFDRTTERAAEHDRADRARPTRRAPRTTESMNAPAHARVAAARRARRAAARQAAGPVEQRRVAEGQAAVARREGRPHRHARSARDRPAAAVLRRGDQVLADQPRRRQALPRDAARWA